MDAPREDLIRMSTEFRHDEDGNTLVGYPAVFGVWTEINSWEGRFNERIAKGAFTKTIRENGKQVKVLFNHGFDPQIGDKPLGKPEVLKEDNRGLYSEVPLVDTSYNGDIKALLRSGALDGMSFRMSVLREEWRKQCDNCTEKFDLERHGWTCPDCNFRNSRYEPVNLPERTIKEVRLYEFGPVTFPAYQATQAGIRAHAPKAFQAWAAATGHEPVIPSEISERSDDPDDSTSTEPVDHPVEERTDDEPADGHPSPDASPDPGHPSHPERPLTRTRMRTDLEYVEAMADIHLSDDRRGRYSHLH